MEYIKYCYVGTVAYNIVKNVQFIYYEARARAIHIQEVIYQRRPTKN